ncbi:MAG: tyrosine-type recombinase/integrase [Opitutus sp.]
MNTLQQDASSYLALRRSLGYKLVGHEDILRRFVAFMREKKIRRITVKLALEFATRGPDDAPKTRSGRLSVVRKFASYQFARDPRTAIPPPGLLPSGGRRAKPYFYSEAEIQRLLDAALKRPALVSLKPWTNYCIFGLLAVTGMRVNEVLNLQCEDIDWSTGMLTIQKSKFGKTRLVPLHPSTMKVLANYATRRKLYLVKRRCAPAPYFFVTREGRRVHKTCLDRMFWRLSRQIGLRGETDSNGPRMHDFRHRFAVETLVRWYRNGEDVDQRMPALSTYLGHGDVTHTYWYLSCTPDLMVAAGKRLQNRWRGVA